MKRLLARNPSHATSRMITIPHYANVVKSW